MAVRSAELGALREPDLVVTVIRGSTQQVTRSFRSGEVAPPFSIGSQGDWTVSAPGVVPVHVWLWFDGASLYAARGDGSAQLHATPLDSDWKPVQKQTELRFGFALLRIAQAPIDYSDASLRKGDRPRRAVSKYVATPLIATLLAVVLVVSRRGTTQLGERDARDEHVRPVLSASVAALPSETPASAKQVPVPQSPAPLLIPPADQLIEQSPPPLIVDAPAFPASVPRAGHAYAKNIADMPIPRIGAQADQVSEEWLAHHQRQLNIRSRSRAKVIFLGDSITEAWGFAPAYAENFAKYVPLNLGISSDLTQNVLWRITHGALDGTSPQVVVVMIGVNNLAGGFSADQTAAGVRAIVSAVQTRLSTAHVVLLSVLPARKEAKDPLRQRIIDTNRLLAALAQPGRVEVHDLGSLFLEPDGAISTSIMPDFIHPTPLGYERLSRAVAPYIEASTPSNAGAAPSDPRPPAVLGNASGGSG
jgi:lysophospholipase L1-like esterase